MNKDIFQGDWNILKGKIKEKWSKLTDDDIMEIQAKRDQLLGKIQKRYGFARDRAVQELNEFEKSFNKNFSDAQMHGKEQPMHHGKGNDRSQQNYNKDFNKH